MKTQRPITLRPEGKTRTQLDMMGTCISGGLPHLQLIEFWGLSCRLTFKTFVTIPSFSSLAV